MKISEAYFYLIFKVLTLNINSSYNRGDSRCWPCSSKEANNSSSTSKPWPPSSLTSWLRCSVRCLEASSSHSLLSITTLHSTELRKLFTRNGRGCRKLMSNYIQLLQLCCIYCEYFIKLLLIIIIYL